uniref:Peptidoglycan binding domain-containing protein n=1 Tax=Candidatus Kentrum sp. DK TaxID=2126562 RepID=A0A450S4L6_9GAMM|nr:MAG: Putative peptidoglycan binding domain-containing protein [Candidatus Kentron sp. DK]
MKKKPAALPIFALRTRSRKNKAPGKSGARPKTHSLWVLAVFFLMGLAISAVADEGTAFPAWAKEDTTAVVTRLKARAEQGDAETQNRLGNMYYHGDGVPEDRERAAYWYRKAANQGYAPGQFNLARLYRAGKGVDQDHALAIHWYRKAAEQGLPIAQFFLGKSYAEGQGVDKDPVVAYRWLDRAAAQGDEDAKWARARLVKGMSPQQRAEVDAGSAAGSTIADAKGADTGGNAGKIQPLPQEKRSQKPSPQGPPAPPAVHNAPSPRFTRVITAQDSGPEPQPGTEKIRLSPEEIRSLQNELRILGLEPGPVDGIMGAKTRAAIRRFRKRIEQKPDGKISRELLETLHAKQRKETS